MLGSLLLLAQVAATPFRAAENHRPVRLWLGPSPVMSGSALQVYVAPDYDGYLLVLRVGTDGRVSVVFPADPTKNGFVARGSYELRGNNGQPAMILNEGRGTGLVLATLSERPYRFTEFSRSGRWDDALLHASYPGADGPGTLSDIAQRMVGDGWFNFDFAMYTVRTEAQRYAARPDPRATTPQTPPAPGEPMDQAQAPWCVGCTVVYESYYPAAEPVEPAYVESYIPPTGVYVSACDIWWGSCYSDRLFNDGRRTDRPPIKTEGICQIGIDCPPGTGKPAKALTMYRGTLTMSPVRKPAPAAPPPLPPPPDYDVAVRRAPGIGAAGLATSQRVVAGPKAATTASVARTSAPARQAAKTSTYAMTRAPKGTIAPRAVGSTGSTGAKLTARQSGTALRASKAMAPVKR